MSNAIVSNVYRYVIDDVIGQVRGDFEDMGIDDSILQELQRSWESKVARSRVANFGFKEENYYDEENGGGGADNSASTAANAGTSTTAAANNNNHMEQQQPTLQYVSSSNTEYNNNNNNNNVPAAASLANLASGGANRNQYGLPPPRMNIPDPSTLVNQYQMMQPPQLNNNNNNNLPELQLPGISSATRPNIPQNDGSNDFFTSDECQTMSTKEIDERIQDIIQSNETEDIEFTAKKYSGEPLALDSLPDHVKELMNKIKKNQLKKISQLDGTGDNSNSDKDEETNKGGDDDINSDLDDTDDEDDDGEGGEEIEHIILCLYDKVTRTKNKWKCILKDGIMLVNGRDYLFHRANGDFEW